MTADIEIVREHLTKYETKLTKILESFKTEMNKVRAGRANPHLLDKIMVDYYGTPTPLNQMANISVPEARMIMISVWDVSAIKNVTKAIMASDLGITPVDDGKTIRLVFPQLTEERRKELVRSIKKTAEDFKVSMRNERRDVLEVFKKLKKDGQMSEDELTVQEKEVQKTIDKYIADLEKALNEKEKEILEI
ncbi:MAG TPA: ribosome recycling factor [Clostridiales bacterium]|jgi:ribosome recycling factor|nr:ribosome recycling factor [Clostridiales bacterium]